MNLNDYNSPSIRRSNIPARSALSVGDERAIVILLWTRKWPRSGAAIQNNLIQGDHSPRQHPPVDVVQTVLAAGGPTARQDGNTSQF